MSTYFAPVQVGAPIETDDVNRYITPINDLEKWREGTLANLADQDLGNHRLTNVTDPAAAQDAATKNYCDTNFTPSTPSFVTMAASAALPNERVLTGTANQVILTDGGAGGGATLSLPQSIHTGATPTFSQLTASTQLNSNALKSQVGPGSGYVTFDGSTGTRLGWTANNYFEALSGSINIVYSGTRVFRASSTNGYMFVDPSTGAGFNWSGDQAAIAASRYYVNIGSVDLFSVGTNVTLRMAAASTGSLTMDGTNGTAIGYSTNKHLYLAASVKTQIGGTDKLTVDANNTVISNALVASGAAVVNEDGGDADFRVEGDTDTHLLFTDASADRLGVGTSSPAQKLDVLGDARLGAASGAQGSRIIGRGEHTSAPAGSLGVGEWELSVYDDGSAPAFRIRYNDGGTIKTGNVALS